MSALSGHVDDYLRLRRALGFKLEAAGQLLAQLVGLPRGRRRATVTSELAIAWARLPARCIRTTGRSGWASPAGSPRYLQTIDPATEVPPPGVFPPAVSAPPPTCSASRTSAACCEEARALRPPLRAATHEALFGLLAVSGMRIGEAIALEREDVDLDAGVITIRQAKFDRARLVPLHPTATEALRRYAAERDRLCPRPRSAAFFLSSAGTPLDRSGVRKTFREITTAHRRPHRRRCARGSTISGTVLPSQTLIDWQRSGVNVDEHIAALSTYLGHVSPGGHLLVPVRLARADGARRRAARTTGSEARR